jgi:NAD(P)-dependent dehydrogenase (short-subunit alcohol dehydrogenase family)
VSEHRIDGKRVVITGATSGIGKAAALELARRGAQLTIVSRDLDKGAHLAQEIAAAAPGAGAELRVVEGDLASFASVREAAAEIRESHDRVDVLINNAGVHAMVPRLTPEGFDHMLASNYLGPFLFTNLLLDLVAAAAPSRIVIVGSEAHRVAGHLDPERFEQLGSYNRLTSNPPYGRTKLLDILFASELARQLGGTGVTVNSLCPGAVATNLFTDAPLIGRLGKLAALSPLIRTPEQGAKMTVRLATDPALDGVTGRFFSSTPGASRLPETRPRQDRALQQRIWERSVKLVGL